MSRVKTFDATGVAPNGKLYAGDLNSIQDHYADLDNLSQNLSVGTMKIGESGLQLLRYGAGEARLTGAMRTDGIIRALGGFLTGQFTTAERNAIPSGFRPYGIVIFNKDTNRYETNVGTDATPVWETQITGTDLFEIPIGGMIDFAGSGDVSTKLILADGRELVRANYPDLFSEIGIEHGAGNGTTTFNIPDCRGRTSVGPDDMGTARGAAGRIPNSVNTIGDSAGVERLALSVGEMPTHAHPGSSVTNAAAFNTNAETTDHTHAGPSHSHGAPGGGVFYGSGGTPSASVPNNGGGYNINTGSQTGAGGSGSTGGRSAAHVHLIPIHGHGLTIASQGSSTPHNNMQPYTILNKLIRVL